MDCSLPILFTGLGLWQMDRWVIDLPNCRHFSLIYLSIVVFLFRAYFPVAYRLHYISRYISGGLRSKELLR